MNLYSRFTLFMSFMVKKQNEPILAGSWPLKAILTKRTHFSSVFLCVLGGKKNKTNPILLHSC